MVKFGLSHIGRNMHTGVKSQIMACVSSGPSRIRCQIRVRSAWNFWRKYLWGRMKRNETEEAERGLRQLHWSDSCEGERGGRKGGWTQSWTAVGSKNFWPSQWGVLERKSPGEEGAYLISLPLGAIGWEQLMGSLTLEITRYWIQLTAPGMSPRYHVERAGFTILEICVVNLCRSLEYFRMVWEERWLIRE